jgi:hypothetical protein
VLGPTKEAPACELPKKTTKTSRALESVSKLWDRAAKDKKTKGQGKPKSPACSKPKSDKPKADKPKAKKPKAEKPKTEKPKAKKPKKCSGKKCKRDEEVMIVDALETEIDARAFDIQEKHDVDDIVEEFKDGGDEFDKDTESFFGKVKRSTFDLIKRMSRKVAMDQAKVYPWKEENSIETTAISVCSVLVVYTRAQIGMAHIPQGRITNGQYVPGTDVINDLTRQLRAAFGNMAGAEAVFYHSDELHQDEVTQITNWIAAQGINNPQIVSFSAPIKGSGTFSISRFGTAWPPYVSFL